MSCILPLGCFQKQIRVIENELTFYLPGQLVAGCFQISPSLVAFKIKRPQMVATPSSNATSLLSQPEDPSQFKPFPHQHPSAKSL